MIRYTADRSAVSARVPSCPSREESSTEPLPPINVRVSVFFDGTGNNIFNTRTRLERNEVPANTLVSDYSSFTNDYSNVAELAMHIIPVNSENDFHVPVYIEGIGTYHGSSESIEGSAYGNGSTGVQDRVTSTLNQLSRIINNLCSETSREISLLKLDVFGFSRGSACARHFIHRYFESGGGMNFPMQTILQLNRITVSTVQFPFIGLFDTVASLGSDHNDDTPTLHLDSISRGEVIRVVHIVASDEHRFNFSLTDIQSAGGKGLEINIPGVHSDVGGGYNNISTFDMSENNLPIIHIEHSPTTTDWDQVLRIQRRFRQDMLRWIRLGWYEESEFVINPNYDPALPNSLLTIAEPLKVRRTNISNAYKKVPLALMSKYATQDGQLQFESDVSSSAIRDSFLTGVYSRIEGNIGQSMDYWVSTVDPQLRQLRHRYFHMSSHYNLTLGLIWAMKPQFFRSDRSGSSAWEYNDEAVIRGERKRRIHPG
ncbi:MAG TPA: DUF2235 domain-containing protein [Flavobacteriales bacterium]|nr:DUF2235 domain-containing protein [Flavobacteriales bacterium]